MISPTLQFSSFFFFFKWHWPEVPSWLPRHQRWALEWLLQEGRGNESLQGVSCLGCPVLALSCSGDDGYIKAKRALSHPSFLALHWQGFALQACFGFSVFILRVCLPLPPSSCPSLSLPPPVPSAERRQECTWVPHSASPAVPRGFRRCSNYPEGSWGLGSTGLQTGSLCPTVHPLSGWGWSPCKVTSRGTVGP